MYRALAKRYRWTADQIASMTPHAHMVFISESRGQTDVYDSMEEYLDSR